MRPKSPTAWPSVLATTLWAMVTVTAWADDPIAPLPPPERVEPGIGLPAQNSPAMGTETLDAAWQMALANDQRLAAARWNTSAAESSLAAACAERLPSLNIGANYYAISDQPAAVLNLPFPMPNSLPLADRESFGGQAVVTQPIYTFGRISHGIDAAAANVQANAHEITRAQLDVKMQVAEAYVAVLRAQRIVGVAQAKAASLSGHSQDTANMLERGLVSRNDFLSAQVSLADAQQQLLQARNTLAVAEAAYNRNLGRPLNYPVALADIDDRSPTDDIELLTQQALGRRPELATLNAQAVALAEQAASTRAKNLPQVGVMGGYLYQENRYIEPNGIAGAAVVMQWNAIDMGRAGNQANALCERSQAVLRQRRDAESLVMLEVRQKWLDMQTARQRVEVARQATSQADENSRVVHDRYQQQIGTNTEVLDAETLRMQAYTNFYNSTYEAVLAGLRLRRAIGDL